jgi:hypothetical protein
MVYRFAKFHPLRFETGHNRRHADKFFRINGSFRPSHQILDSR